MQQQTVTMTPREAALYRAGVSFGAADALQQTADQLRQTADAYRQQLAEQHGEEAARQMAPWVQIFSDLSGQIARHAETTRASAAKQMLDAARASRGRGLIETVRRRTARAIGR